MLMLILITYDYVYYIIDIYLDSAQNRYVRIILNINN